MPRTLRGKGDAIEGERVICTARKVIVKKPAKGSSRHRIQEGHPGEKCKVCYSETLEV